jgi:hypothetical protein
MQLDQTVELIEMVLRNRGIEISEGKLPKALIKKGGNLRRRRS